MANGNCGQRRSDVVGVIRVAATEKAVFLDDARVPLDNNASERSLRRIALGRKDFLFVGHENAGDNVAALYTLVATCEAHGVNPFEYLRDVLVRVSTHSASDIDALLPHRWSPTAMPAQ